MKLTTKISGRLGDLTARVFLAFIAAKKKKVDFKDVVFQRYSKNIGLGCNRDKYKSTGLFDIPNYIDYNIEWFNNIITNFVSNNEYDSIMKNAIPIRYDDFIASPIDNFILGKTVDLTNVKIANAFNNECWYDLFFTLFFNSQIYQKNLHLYNDISQRIGIHVRRTDYLDAFKDQVFSKTEIDKIISQHHNSKFIIFSDDIEWCKNNIKHNKVNIIFHSPNCKSYNDVYLMAMTKELIYRRSYFAYMAKYFQAAMKKCLNRKMYE